MLRSYISLYSVKIWQAEQLDFVSIRVMLSEKSDCWRFHFCAIFTIGAPEKRNGQCREWLFCGTVKTVPYINHSARSFMS